MDRDNNLEDIEELDFNYNDGSKISLYENPIRTGRKDKSTFITEGDLSMKSSNIMLGNDNKNLQDGVYVNEDEIKNALSKYLNELSAIRPSTLSITFLIPVLYCVSSLPSS